MPNYKSNNRNLRSRKIFTSEENKCITGTIEDDKQKDKPSEITKNIGVTGENKKTKSKTGQDDGKQNEPSEVMMECIDGKEEKNSTNKAKQNDKQQDKPSENQGPTTLVKFEIEHVYDVKDVLIKTEPSEVSKSKKFKNQTIICVDSSDEDNDDSDHHDDASKNSTEASSVENAKSGQVEKQPENDDTECNKKDENNGSTNDGSKEAVVECKEEESKNVKEIVKNEYKSKIVKKNENFDEDSWDEDSSEDIDDDDDSSYSEGEKFKRKYSKKIVKKAPSDECENVNEETTVTNNVERLSVRPAQQLFETVASSDDNNVLKDHHEVKGTNEGNKGDNLDNNFSVSNASVISVLNAEQLGVSTADTIPSAVISDVNGQFQPSAAVNQFGPIINALGDGIMCDVCNQRYVDDVVLEHHKVSASHFKCYYCAELTTFSSRSDLANHNHSVHGIQSSVAPIDQLAQQVQSMPVSYHPQSLSTQNYNQPVIMDVKSKSVPNFGQQQQRTLQRNDQSFANSNYTSPRTPVKRSVVQLSPKSTPPPAKRRILEDSPGNSSRGGGSPVMRQLSKSITLTPRKNQNTKTGDTNAVASILANRGLTVTATKNSNVGSRNDGNSMSINLNSAVSIIPTTSPNRQAMSTGKSINRSPNSKTPTVDLTGPDDTSNRSGRGRQFICQVCDKVFPFQENLNTHMTTHRSPRRYLAHRCYQCTASFSTQQDLVQHKNTFHRNSASGNTAKSRNNASGNTAGSKTMNVCIPLVKMGETSTINHLRSLGIRHFISTSVVVDSNGIAGIPVTHGSVGNNCSFEALGISLSLNLGSLVEFNSDSNSRSSKSFR